jgi:hypothetical protein
MYVSDRVYGNKGIIDKWLQGKSLCHL